MGPLNLEEFFGGPIFRYGVFPLVSAAAGIALKCVSRNDGYAFFKKEDMAVGPQLMLTAALTYVVLTTDKARTLTAVSQAMRAADSDKVRLAQLESQALSLTHSLLAAAWTVVVLIVGLWGIVTIVKRWGWADEASLKPVVGIAAPLVVGVVTLIYVMSAAAS